MTEILAVVSAALFALAYARVVAVNHRLRARLRDAEVPPWVRH